VAIARASAVADAGPTGAPRALRPTARRFSLDLRLPAEAASLTLVRHAIGGTAAALGMPPAAVADVRLALTEACSAAIRRAAADDGGHAELHITAGLSDGALRVVVEHLGDGVGPGAPGDGLPLPLVAALADAVELTRGHGGTEVAMTFSTARAHSDDLTTAPGIR
jgi:anti-sigma regulatory factor (Ser/Thr protein kinase)